MHPILFHIGPYPVRAYSLAILLAVVASAALAIWVGKRRNLPWTHHYVDMAPLVLLGGIVGARVWEVIFQWSTYAANPQEILQVWRGGLSIQGGILGGMGVAWLYARRHSIPFRRLLDAVTPSLLLGQGVGRLLGCTFNGDAYGKPTGTSWGIVHAPGTMAHTHFGAQPLWPAEVFEGVFDLALVAFFLRLGINRGPAGHHFLLYGVAYSVGRFFLEFLRADTGPLVGTLTAAQVGSLGVMLLCGLLMAHNARRHSPPLQSGS